MRASYLKKMLKDVPDDEEVAVPFIWTRATYDLWRSPEQGDVNAGVWKYAVAEFERGGGSVDAMAGLIDHLDEHVYREERKLGLDIQANN
jgi:hypothetical protein